MRGNIQIIINIYYIYEIIMKYFIFSTVVLFLASGCGGGGSGGGDSSQFGDYDGTYRAAIVKESDNCQQGFTGSDRIMEFYQDKNSLFVNFLGASYSGVATADSFSVAHEQEVSFPDITCLNEATLSGSPSQAGNYDILNIEFRIVARRCNRPTRGCEAIYRGTAVKEYL